MLTRPIMPTDFAVLHYECFNAETSGDSLQFVDGVTTGGSLTPPTAPPSGLGGRAGGEGGKRAEQGGDLRVVAVLLWKLLVCSCARTLLDRSKRQRGIAAGGYRSIRVCFARTQRCEQLRRAPFALASTLRCVRR